MLLNQGYVPCNKQIHIKIPENELQMIHDRMEKIGVKNMSAYIRKMAIDGYYIHIDFSELLEIIKLLKIDSNNINQIAKVANSCGTVDGKTISDMKENHERVKERHGKHGELHDPARRQDGHLAGPHDLRDLQSRVRPLPLGDQKGAKGCQRLT